MNLLNFCRLLVAAGLLSVLGSMITAIGSQSRYEDVLPSVLFMAGCIAVGVGALGLLVIGAAA